MATKRETAKALAGSIEKWRAIVEKRETDDGADNCPLCELFILQTDTCDGCPVAKAGHSDCATGPYDHWASHQINKHTTSFPRKIRCGACTRLARAELKFLEGLRDG